MPGPRTPGKCGKHDARYLRLFLKLIISHAYRFCLNYKGIPYKTEWVEYPDIEAHCTKLGIAPTSKKADGSPAYTLPAIHDTATGIYLSDSFPIAEYLEKTYPDKPSLFPGHSHGLQALFDGAFVDAALTPAFQFILPATCPTLNSRSEEYFRRTREQTFGKALEDVVPKGEEGVAQWAKFKDGLGKVDTWYAKSGGVFLMGGSISWADLDIAAWLIWMKIVWGEESTQWKDIASWQGGRWKNLLGNLKQYQTVV